MRADFWDRPLRHGSFARLIEHSVVNVTALAPDELERAITEPAAATGCEFEPGLVSEIVADVADEPGALPLLQYALTELCSILYTVLNAASARNARQRAARSSRSPSMNRRP